MAAQSADASPRPAVPTGSPSPAYDLVYVNGTFVASGDAAVSVYANALAYGTGIFEGIRAFWDGASELYMLAAREHFERMSRSARVLGIALPHSAAELVEISAELLRRNRVREDAYLRPLFILSGETLQVRIEGISTRFSITVTPLGLNYIEPRGVRCIVSAWRRNPDVALPSRAKLTGGYVGPAMAKTEALRSGVDEAIMLNIDGHVAEATTSNILLRHGDEWSTPPVSGDILEGITRRQVTTLLAARFGRQVRERSIDRSELYTADEMLLCGTAAMVVPVVEVDFRPVGDGRAGATTLTLQAALVGIARGQDLEYRDWIAPVYGCHTERTLVES